MPTKPQLIVDNKDHPTARVAPAGEPPQDGGMEARVAVLEQIVKDTREILTEIKTDLRDMRKEQASGFRWLLGLGIGAVAFLIAADCGLFGLMAHGFHWL